MCEFGASAIEAIRSACLEPDIEKHFNSDRQFLPAAHAKHTVPSSYPKNNPTQDATCGVATKGRGKGNTKGSARGKHQLLVENLLLLVPVKKKLVARILLETLMSLISHRLALNLWHHL